MPRMCSKTSIWTLTVAIFILIHCSASQPLPQEPFIETPDSIVPPPLSEAYTNSRFHQDCLKTTPSTCACMNLWDSPCNCNESDKTALQNGTNPNGCNCAWLCEELWVPGRPLTDMMKHQCHIPQIRRYTLRAFIGSRQKESGDLIVHLKRLMEVMGPAIDFSIHYLVYIQNNRLTAEGGVNELEGNMIGKCAMLLYPQPEVYLPFLACMGMNTSWVPQTFRNCTRLHGVSYTNIRTCANTQGEGLLSNDLVAASHYRVDSTPRVFMDDRYFNPGSSADYVSYEAAMCYVFANSSRPFPWFIFFIMGAIIVLIIVIFFTVKRWSRVPFLDNLSSFFLWNNPNADPADTLLYLRAYGLIDDEDEALRNENEPDLEAPPPSQPDATSDNDDPPNPDSESRRDRRSRRRRRRREDQQNTSESEAPASEQPRSSRRSRNSSRRHRNTDNSQTNNTDSSSPNTTRRSRRRATDTTPVASSSQPEPIAESSEVQMDTIPDYYYSSDDDQSPNEAIQRLLQK